MSVRQGQQTYQYGALLTPSPLATSSSSVPMEDNKSLRSFLPCVLAAPPKPLAELLLATLRLAGAAEDRVPILGNLAMRWGTIVASIVFKFAIFDIHHAFARVVSSACTVHGHGR
ncbi:hypothetical protein KCU92_g255, partial [Aureobasidium melanogenum]